MGSQLIDGTPKKEKNIFDKSVSVKFSSRVKRGRWKKEAKTTSQGHWRKVKRHGSEKHLSRSLATSCNKANVHVDADVPDVMHLTSAGQLDLRAVYNLESLLKVSGP